MYDDARATTDPDALRGDAREAGGG